METSPEDAPCLTQLESAVTVGTEGDIVGASLDSEGEAASSKAPSISEPEEGLLEVSSDESEPSKAACKRPCSVLSNNGDEAGPTKKVKKKISFSEVTAYYFPRAQGFTCVPSQGGSTLGMALKHSHEESFTVSEHATQQRRNHRRLLLQLRKRRKSQRQQPKEAAEGAKPDEGNSSEAGEVEPSKESPTAESDSEEEDSDNGQQISDLSDSELDVDNYYFLQPVPTRQRRAMLRESGVGKIETSEKDDCRQIRVSRESCGCSCQGYCEPESCSCAQSGIQCQVDRLNFPCGCTRDACANPSGRVEFNPVRVRTHFIHTLMRLELENSAEQGALEGSSKSGVPHHLLHQPLQPVDEVPSDAVDGLAEQCAMPTDPNYQWENIMPPQESHSAYSLADPLAAENGWFNPVSHHYGSAPVNPPYYAGVASSTPEVFGNVYDPVAPSYDSLIYHGETPAEPVHHPTQEPQEQQQQQPSTLYTELGSSSGGAGNQVGYGTYTDYVVGQAYPSFDHNGFGSYEAPDAYRSVASEDVYNFPPEGGHSYAGPCHNDTSVVDLHHHHHSVGTEAPIKAAAAAAESSSSSEEDALSDMSSSLATIVKETMVSV